MTTSLDFDYDLKSSTGGELGLFLVLVSSFVLTASVVVVDSVLGNPLVGVSTVANTSPNLLSGALGWPSCSRAHFWSHNVLRPSWALALYSLWLDGSHWNRCLLQFPPYRPLLPPCQLTPLKYLSLHGGT
jgi:hypothetical protein